MAWSKPLDDIELAYIEKSWPRLSCAEIARRLGRSKRAVELAVNRLGLREPRAPAHALEERAHAHEAPGAGPGRCAPEPTDEAQDEIAELREIRRMLKKTMKNEAGPQTMPKLSAELREVIKRISELEGDGDDEGGPMAGGAGNLIVSVPLRPA